MLLSNKIENILYSGCLLNSQTSNPFGKQWSIIASSSPTNFLSIGFDSLGAVIGIISSSFILPILIGLTNSTLDTYGYVALIGIIPVIFLEIAGFIYEREIVHHDYNKLDDGVVIYD